MAIRGSEAKEDRLTLVAISGSEAKGDILTFTQSLLVEPEDSERTGEGAVLQEQQNRDC